MLTDVPKRTYANNILNARMKFNSCLSRCRFCVNTKIESLLPEMLRFSSFYNFRYSHVINNLQQTLSAVANSEYVEKIAMVRI